MHLQWESIGGGRERETERERDRVRMIRGEIYKVAAVVERVMKVGLKKKLRKVRDAEKETVRK